MRSSAYSFNFPNPLFSLRPFNSCLHFISRLLVPSIFLSIRCCRRQFVRSLWLIQWAFLRMVSQFSRSAVIFVGAFVFMPICLFPRYSDCIRLWLSCTRNNWQIMHIPTQVPIKMSGFEFWDTVFHLDQETNTIKRGWPAKLIVELVQPPHNELLKTRVSVNLIGCQKYCPFWKINDFFETVKSSWM